MHTLLSVHTRIYQGRNHMRKIGQRHSLLCQYIERLTMPRMYCVQRLWVGPKVSMR